MGPGSGGWGSDSAAASADTCPAICSDAAMGRGRRAGGMDANGAGLAHFTC